MISIRALLDTLALAEPPAIPRLCVVRRLRRRGAAAKIQSLTRSYRGDHSKFLGDLRKPELVALLKSVTAPDGTARPPSGISSYSRLRLVDLALQIFRDGVLPPERARRRPAASTAAATDADDEGGDNESDTGESPRSAEYAKQLLEDFAYSTEDAARPLRAYQTRAVEVVLRALSPETPRILHLATGGGKTRVANEIVVQWARRHEGTVLWITKDWRLLHQAARDLSRRHRLGRLTRLGGNGQTLHPLTDDSRGEVVYTTLHTLFRRLDETVSPGAGVTLLVWDECHWGEHGRAGRILTACKRAGIPVLGLTATPRRQSRYQVAFSKSFLELVDEGFLARPVVQSAVQTGVRWRPQLRGRFEDVTRASLEVLATNHRRNVCIVNHYVDNVARYGKTIVFACGISHVNVLTNMFLHRGLTARPMHSDRDDDDNRRALEEFRDGTVQILVNMEMLTHGVDVPDARTVFLCRPTTSEILFAQMVGRAARRDDTSGKTSFFVVEFTDNVSEHGELFRTALRHFEGASGSGARTTLSRGEIPRRRAHAFDPLGAPRWIPDEPTLPESLRGLWYREGQTFGIEFELTTLSGPPPELGRAWKIIAEQLRARLAEALPGRVADSVIEGYAGSEGGKDNSVWNVEYDRSAGWEVTSRILANQDGFLEVEAACAALDLAAAELSLRVDHRTGTHVHVGWLASHLDEVQRAIALTRLFEPALATLVAPSRLVRLANKRYDLRQPNDYCRPISTVFSERVLAAARSLEELLDVVTPEETRNVTFNLRPLATLQTVEIRLHSGTLESRKILLWVSLWQQILWAAGQPLDVPAVPDRSVIHPDGDIVQLAARYLPDGQTPQQSGLAQRLAARRAEIRDEQWSRFPELKAWVTATAGWALPAASP
jgi:superfamily II DNA or RNA helicase